MRLRAVLAELTAFVTKNGTGKHKRMAFVMKRVAQDVCEEMQDSDAETISAYFDQMGSVISWIGHGNNDRLPEPLRELFLPRAEGIQLAIDTSDSSRVEDEAMKTIEDVVTVANGVHTKLSGTDTWTG